MKKGVLILAVLSVCFLSGCSKEETKLVEIQNTDNMVVEPKNQEEQETIAYTEEQLIEMVKNYRAVRGEYIPEFVEVDHSIIADDGIINIHLYDIVDNHAATIDWYMINPLTGKGINFFDKMVDLNNPLASSVVTGYRKLDREKNDFNDKFFLATPQMPETEIYHLSQINIQLDNTIDPKVDAIDVSFSKKDGKTWIKISHAPSIECQLISYGLKGNLLSIVLEKKTYPGSDYQVLNIDLANNKVLTREEFLAKLNKKEEQLVQGVTQIEKRLLNEFTFDMKIQEREEQVLQMSEDLKEVASFYYNEQGNLSFESSIPVGWPGAGMPKYLYDLEAGRMIEGIFGY